MIWLIIYLLLTIPNYFFIRYALNWASSKPEFKFKDDEKAKKAFRIVYTILYPLFYILGILVCLISILGTLFLIIAGKKKLLNRSKKD